LEENPESSVFLGCCKPTTFGATAEKVLHFIFIGAVEVEFQDDPTNLLSDKSFLAKLIKF
jgi:hypothetical protein